MTPARPLRVEVGDLLERPNTRRPLHCNVTLGDGLSVVGSRLDLRHEIEVDLVLESMPSGVAASGTVEFAWVGECRRCLDEVRGTARPALHEMFETDPTPQETFPVENSQIDLEPVVREAVALGLPLAPLCGDDCRGPAPETFPAHRPGELEAREAEPGATGMDPRWAALDDLTFE